MRLPYTSFPLLMAILIMILAVWAVPGYARLVLIISTILGAGLAFFKLRRSRSFEE